MALTLTIIAQFDDYGILTRYTDRAIVPLMVSPGAGKTTLLLATLEALRNHWRVGVIDR
jgi:Ni2+-binding GTPase involved in maturation of urease and hydrogenase